MRLLSAASVPIWGRGAHGTLTVSGSVFVDWIGRSEFDRDGLGVVVPHRSQRWVWAGRLAFAVIVAGLTAYLVMVGLDKADKLGSGISVVVALVALAAPYLLPPPSAVAPMVEPDRVDHSGAAHATGGGQANTGLDAVGDDRSAHVTCSGDATAHGPGSVTNTGIQRRGRT